MKKIAVGTILLLLTQFTWGQYFPQTVPRKYFSDSTYVIPRRPWLAGAETFTVNMVVWGFNRYISQVDFAKINGHTIKDNFQTGPIWDTDKFTTNLISHPYHGSLYFNAARSNGLSFWQSIPYTAGGSLMWEFFMEAEPPSINDMFATTFGGVELGEILFRLSDIFLDDRTSGPERIGREILSGILSPVRAVNRLVTGDAWRYRSHKGRTFPSVPINFIVNVGPRFLAEQEQSKHGTTSMNVNFNLAYGTPFGDDFYSPYEWFKLQVGVDLFSSQPLISQVSAIGALWGKQVWEKGNRKLTTGVFQHFDYYDSELRSNSENTVAPYRISEAAAIGGGLLYNKESSAADPIDIYAEFYLNGVALGASISDYLKLEERDYNLGSGYSIKGFTGLTYKKKWNFALNMENYHIFTWKGYDPDLDFSTIDLERLNVQGEKSNARLTVFSTHLSYFKNRWNITLSNRYFSRHTRYKYYENVTTSTYDLSLSIGWRI
ncbi:DUF3943 domain-containing protein [Parabacteroides sp. 52]|uniref:DUF3943 domain-containing protein n=1 Tax=unclassified Parabacteroides TaxID=2649774 RepID=UPI0013D87254|nr:MULTISPECIES: DUF3943 domain-containing protein [unclassified Parabacteroides]MDH6535689.1 hypothetical protein [Parabacteroides sp. PM5-20]NDV56339.1 DUF3943 domain-containing protein [Parabacteroides sp. 52]